MHIVLLCRSLTNAQKAARIIQKSGMFAVVTKAPQGADPGGCGYGVKIAQRNLDAALALLARSDVEVLRTVELPERGDRR